MSDQVIVLEPADAEARAALETAMRATDRGERGRALRDVAARWPLYLEAWARLGELAYEEDDPVAAYAFCRVGYHRGLDQLRAAGWRGSQQVPFAEPTNHGFLLALHGLMRAAAAISEGVEARRCREFLLQLDPSDALGVGSIRPAALSRRIED